jgi:hypothetical protein
MALVSAEQGVAELGNLVRDLLFVSEADYPFCVVLLAVLPELDERRLLSALAKPEGLLVTQRTLEEFFARAVEDQPWHGPRERAAVERYRALLRFLATALEQARVFRVGSIEVDAYALGKTNDGRWLGVATKLIET